MTRLPKEYQEVEYLQGTGTQYIRTGYFATGNTSIKIKYKYDVVDGNGIFGSRDNATPTNALLMWGSNTGYWRFQYGNQNFNSSISRDDNWHVCEQDKNVCYIDGELVYTFNKQTFQNSYEQLLFGIGGSGTTLSSYYLSQSKIAYAEYRENGILICEFIPCYRKADKVAGMYDTINHEFLTNMGTGEFIVGADVLYADDLQEIEYLQSSGQQYIHTDFIPTTTTGWEAKLSSTATGTNWAMGANFWVGVHYANTKVGIVNSSAVANQQYVGYNHDDTPVTLKLQGTSVYADGNLLGTIVRRAGTVPFTIFGYRNNATSSGLFFTGKIYFVKLFDGDVLKYHFKPFRRKDTGEVGMYETVEGKFYTNKGSGSFIGGADVSTPKLRMTYYQGNDVPSAYHKLDYLQTSSNSKAYMITDYKQTNATTLKIVAEGAGWLMGGRTSSTVTDGLGILTASQAIYAMYGSENKNVARNFTTGIHTYEIGRGGLWVDGEKLIDYTPQIFKSQSLMWLWNIDDKGVPNNSYFVGKIYSAQILENGQVVRDYVPVYRDTDGVNGMYDRCFGGFIANAGGGIFTRGNEYEELEYLESTGTQYIDTGWHPTSANLEVDFKIMALQSMATSSVCGDENSLYTGARWLFTLYGQKNDWQQYPLIGTWNNASGSGYHITTPKNEIVSVNLKYNNGVTACVSSKGDNWEHTQTGDVITNHVGSLKLFQNTATQKSIIRMYRYTIKDNGIIVRDFVPVRNKTTNTLGLYDKANYTFYPNNGTGSFIAGKVKQKMMLRFIYTPQNILPDGYRQLESLNLNLSLSMNTGISYQASSIEQVIKFNTKNKRQLIGFSSSNTTYWGVTADNQYEVGPNFIIPATEKDPFEWHKVVFHTDGQSGAGRVVSIVVDDEATVSRVGSGGITGLHEYDITSSGYINDAEIKYIKKTLDENNEVVSWLYPALRESDNQVGWYDTITNQFRVIGQAIAGTQTYYKQLRFIGA